VIFFGLPASPPKVLNPGVVEISSAACNVVFKANSNF